jgi:hypothetical protein
MATFSFQFDPGSRRAPGTVHRLFLSLFFALFFGMGLLALALMVRSAAQTLRTYGWTETPCRILHGAVETGRDSDRPYAFWVEYTYEAGGQTHVSSRYTLNYAGSSEYTEVQALLDRYRPDDNETCFVDPADPKSAVLEREGLWDLLFVFVPLLFVAVGAGGIWFAWRGFLKKPDPLQSTVPALSQKAAGRGGPLLLAGFFSIFLLTGLGLLYPFGVKPILRAIDARSWRETPCTVLSGDVRSHRSDDGTTYSVHILFEYAADGRTFRSDRYLLESYSSSGYEEKAAVVERLPPGSRAVCYVNPRDPVEAVMVRNASGAILLALFPLIFSLAGGGGVYFGLRAWWRQRRARTEPAGPTASAVPAAPRGPAPLRAVASPLAKLLGVALMAAFWNGIVSVFVWQAVQGWRRGHPDVALTLFMSVFVFVGLALIGATLYFFLALFNPRVRLRLSGEMLRLGDAADLEWSLSRGARSVTRLRLILEGREEATHSGGKSSSTSKEVFFSETLVDTVPAESSPSGTARLALPADSMHSFKSAHNKIVWAVQVKGEIPEWPDMDEEFDLEVFPRRGPAGGAR